MGEDFSKDRFLVEERLFDFIAHLSKSDPVSVWLLHSAENDPDTFNQFVRPNGEFYCTKTFHAKMEKTKMGFLMVASEMVNKILLQQSNEQIYAGNNRITQSYNPPAGFKI